MICNISKIEKRQQKVTETLFQTYLQKETVLIIKNSTIINLLKKNSFYSKF